MIKFGHHIQYPILANEMAWIKLLVTEGSPFIFYIIYRGPRISEFRCLDSFEQ